ncbi:MAG: hypothetical protein HC860_02110 [Alkalinema sp. RU_4_3]|nr:hypothetical protein [Alkalinema sp. RU_4_3]
MNRKFIAFSLLGLAFTGVSAGLAVANSDRTNQPICHVQQSDNQQRDLTKFCGQSEAKPAGLLDPNAPVDFNLPRSATPSELWNSVPDAEEPIEMGETYTPAAPSNPAPQPQSTSEAPSGGSIDN